MSKVLIPGASDFIGRALSANLTERDYELELMESADGDIARTDSLKPIADEDISHVYNLVGKTYFPDSWEHPAQCF